MGLKELKDRLYKPKSEFKDRPQEPEIFEPGRAWEKIESKDWPLEEIKKNKFSIFDLLSKYEKYLIRAGLILLGVVLLVAVLFIWYGLTSFDKNKVQLLITGPERIVSGEEVIYTVKYINNTRLDLKKMQLIFYYPDGSITDKNNNIETVNLPDLPAKNENQTSFKFRIIGLKDEIKNIKTEMSYEPGKINSRFMNQAEFSSKIISVPLALNFDLPEKLISGQDFSFSLRYSNQSDASFDNIRVQIEYPEGFIVESFDPIAVEENNIWAIGNLMAGEQGRIYISGKISGDEGQIKSFRAKLGVMENNEFNAYTETVDASQIALSPLFISQTVNNSVNYIAKKDEELTYRINYKNTTDTGIKDVIIISKLEGNVLNFNSLRLGAGSFDGNDQTIVWKASNLPALAYLEPNQEGQIEFSITVKDPLPIRNYNDKNFIITNTVKIYSLKAPPSLERISLESESQSITKVATELLAMSKGYYYDDTIINSGPIPPRVGQRTTYTIKWQLINTSNDVDSVKVEAFLPPHVEWLNQIAPATSDINYYADSNKLIWRVGFLSSGTGVILPVRQIAFQIAITPGQVHVGNLMELIGDTTITGHDQFTDQNIENISRAIDTDLPDDPRINSRDGVVVE